MNTRLSPLSAMMCILVGSACSFLQTIKFSLSEPSTNALEVHIAQLTGKEAALFVPSGAASNQIALRTHLMQPPYSVMCDHRAHIHK
jgi:7-keto-8-aminopelargonate synthetase-like enzyme